MKYKVLNDNNAVTYLTDEDIHNHVVNQEPVKCEYVMAIRQTGQKSYLPYLLRALQDERIYIRREAAISIMIIGGEQGLQALKAKEHQIDEVNFLEKPTFNINYIFAKNYQTM